MYSTLSVVFYGGTSEAAAAFAVLEALVSSGFELSQVAASGMSAVGSAMFLAGMSSDAAERYVALMRLEDGTEIAVSEVCGAFYGSRISEFDVPLSVVFTDILSGRTIICGDDAYPVPVRTEYTVHLADMPLKTVIAASACPWVSAVPVCTEFGTLCGVQSAAGIRYMQSMCGGSRDGAVVNVIFSQHDFTDMRSGIAMLLSENIRLLAGKFGGYELEIALSGDTRKIFEDVRRKIYDVQDDIRLYCLMGKNVV